MMYDTRKVLDPGAQWLSTQVSYQNYNPTQLGGVTITDCLFISKRKLPSPILCLKHLRIWPSTG